LKIVRPPVGIIASPIGDAGGKDLFGPTGASLAARVVSHKIGSNDEQPRPGIPLYVPRPAGT
jgi:hypothetical protein